MSSTTPVADTELHSTESTTVRNTPARLPFHPDVFESATKKQRFILIAARDAVLRGEPTNTGIARVADVSRTYINKALSKFINRQDLPVACTVANQCVSRKDYADLSDTQRRIVNESVINPELTLDKVADIVGCSRQHVNATTCIYSDLLQEKNNRENPLETPVETSDVSLDMFDMKMDDLPVIPEEVSIALHQPFNMDTLMELSPQHRFIVLTAREWALRGDATVQNIITTTETASRSMIEVALGQFINKTDEHPVAGTAATQVFPNHRYETLTKLQSDIVDTVVINPHSTLQQIAAAADCSLPYASHVRNFCASIIDEKRATIAAAYTESQNPPSTA